MICIVQLLKEIQMRNGILIRERLRKEMISKELYEINSKYGTLFLSKSRKGIRCKDTVSA